MNTEQARAVTPQEGARAQVPHTIRPGDVLADRYLLVDLLTETGSGRFWRAHDRVLERTVAVHVVAADDPSAAAMMEASRSSAALHDRRVLRVLDVDERDGLCYVVNEWGSGTSLDILVANEGPIGARRAAWIVSEVAASLTAAHEAGVAHGRLTPENVLIDDSGSVRVIGCAVECALLGLPPGRISSDVTDLAGLLYFLLTGTWPGVSRSAVPPAPSEGGRVLRPRQVKAGVPRALDTLCDRVLDPYASGPEQAELLTARGVRDALREFVGDPSGLASAEAAGLHTTGESIGTRLMPLVPPGAIGPAAPAPPTAPATDAATDVGGVAAGPGPEPADPGPAQSGPEQTVALPSGSTPGDDDTTHAPPPGQGSGPRPVVDQPTQAGMPIFGEDDDDVSWFAARAEKPKPPPAFEEPPERPLFAPEPAGGAPARRPRPGAATPTGTGDYWPWAAGSGTGTGSAVIPVVGEDDGDDGVPGRSWLRLAAAVGVSTLLLVAVVFAFNLGRGRSPLGEVREEESPTDTPSASEAAPTAVTDITATDFDPQGSPPEENPELAALAVDGDPATAWRTSTYEQDLGPTGLKTGVGMLLDLGGATDVAEIDLTLVGAPTELSVYVTDTAPSRVRPLDPVDTGTAEGPRREIVLDEPVVGRFVVVWLTSLPGVPDGFRGEVAEVEVRG